MAQDLRHALRLLRKSPGFSLTVMLLLSLGIGLNSAIFSLLDAVLLRPLPVRHPEQLVRLVQIRPVIGARSSYPLEVVQALQKYSKSFSDVFAFEDRNGAVRDASGASRVRCQIVTGNFFTVLGVRPFYGRLLGPEDETASAGVPPVVLSYAYWRRALDGNPDIVGHTIMLQNRAFTVVGVTPREFNGITLETTPDIRVPRIAECELADEEDGRIILGYDYSIVARLKPGITLRRARAESAGIVAAALGEASRRLPGRTDWDPASFDLQSVSRGVSLLRPKFSGALILLMSGVGLLLLMICANVAGLLLARSSARRQEAAVRLAVGATGARLVRQWLTESLLLTMLGGLSGIAVAFAATPLLARALPPVRDFDATALTLSLDLRPDWRVLLFSLALCVLTALAGDFPPLCRPPEKICTLH